jgi:hypothetical protein
VEAIREYSAGGELNRDLHVEWASLFTSLGFRENPDFTEALPIKVEDLIEVDSRFPILCCEVPNTEELLLSANGYAMTCPWNTRVVDLVGKLNQAVPLLVGDLLNQFCGTVESGSEILEIDEETILELLNTFAGVGALRRVGHEFPK